MSRAFPSGARISYGDGTNAQDLKNYNVFVIPEPNIRLHAAEITAIRNFVQNGGGLFMISDHAGADRNNDGWDAAEIFNDLMGIPSVFGITFNDNSADTTFGWFDNHPDDNFTTDTTSPIICTGAFGVPSSGRGLGLFGSTSMTLSGSGEGPHLEDGVDARHDRPASTFATSTYGTGRVAAVGDSSIDRRRHQRLRPHDVPRLQRSELRQRSAHRERGGLARQRVGGGGGDTTPPTVSITVPGERRDGQRHGLRQRHRIRQRRRDEGRVLPRRRAQEHRHDLAVLVELGHHDRRERLALAHCEGVRRGEQLEDLGCGQRHGEQRHRPRTSPAGRSRRPTPR